MLDGEIPKASIAPAPTELELHLPKTSQPAFFWGGCETKREGVQNTLGLRRCRFLSPSSQVFAQLQSPSSSICTTQRNGQSLDPTTCTLEPLVASSMALSWCPCALAGVLVCWGCLKVDGFPPITLESPDFYPWEFPAPFQRVKPCAEFGAGGEWRWRSSIIRKVSKASETPPSPAPSPPHTQTLLCFKA